MAHEFAKYAESKVTKSRAKKFMKGYADGGDVSDTSTSSALIRDALSDIDNEVASGTKSAEAIGNRGALSGKARGGKVRLDHRKRGGKIKHRDMGGDVNLDIDGLSGQVSGGSGSSPMSGLAKMAGAMGKSMSTPATKPAMSTPPAASPVNVGRPTQMPSVIPGAPGSTPFGAPHAAGGAIGGKNYKYRQVTKGGAGGGLGRLQKAGL